MADMEAMVVIVGAGPSGIATSACLNQLCIPNLILEREDCCASLWKNHTYDRLNLHLAKEFCFLPHMPHSFTTPTYLSKSEFVEYLDRYVSQFCIKPRFYRTVVSAFYDEGENRWVIKAKNGLSGHVEVYYAKFFVVASGENNQGFVPEIPGLDRFEGEILHSSDYTNGLKYKSKRVLVVGCGNSGMEIAFDLSNFGAQASIVVRNPFHVASRSSIRLGMSLCKFFPVSVVDFLVTSIAKIEFGDLTEFGITRPKEGIFYLKEARGRSPVIDVGTVKKIREGNIQVLPAISHIKGRHVAFDNATKFEFDVIVFATGYKSLANKWLKDYMFALNADGMPKNRFPAHWKGQKGLYCAGLSKRGLAGVSADAMAIAKDIKMVIEAEKEKLK